MAVGLLAGLGLFGMGMAKGAVDISKNEQEVQQRRDELDQKNSDIRLAAEHKRLSTDWDKTNKLIQSVKDDPTSKASQYALAKHSGKVSSLVEFKELRGDTVWEVPNQGDRPTLQYLDVADYRAPSRRGIDVLKQTVGFSDAEEYTGSTVLERERELLGGTTTSTYRRMVDEDRNIVLGRRAFEKRLSDSSAGVKQRFLQYKNNLSNFPREAEAVKGLKGAELDNKLFAIAFAQEEYESGTAGSFSPSDAYWDARGGSLTIDDSGVILSTNTGDKKVDSINNQINNINAKITTAADPQDNKKNTAQVKLLQQNKEKHLTGLEDWKAKVDEAAYKNLLNAKSTGQREEYFATQLGNLGNIIKGIEGNDLTTSKYRTKGYKESNKAGGPFTLKGKHLYNNLENAQMYSNSHAVMVAKGDKATPLSSLSFEAINSKISSDIVKRTFTYIDKGLYDTDAIFSIPYPSKDFVGVEYQEEYNVASWTKLIDDYVNDSDDLTDDSLQRKLNSLYDDIRDGTITIPSNVDVGVDVTPLPDSPPEPIPVSELQPGELGHIVTKVKEGKNITYIMTDKGYIPYDTSPVTPIVDTPIVEQTIGQQLATLLLTTQKTIKDIKQQASIDLSAAVSSDSKKIINQKALLAIKTAETQYLKDRATLEGK